ncbi:unnamed protein product, partial [Cuscuta campestris]
GGGGENIEEMSSHVEGFYPEVRRKVSLKEKSADNVVDCADSAFCAAILLARVGAGEAKKNSERFKKGTPFMKSGGTMQTALSKRPNSAVERNTVNQFVPTALYNTPTALSQGDKSRAATSGKSKSKSRAPTTSTEERLYYGDGSYLWFDSEEERTRFLTFFSKRVVAPPRIIPERYPELQGYDDLDAHLHQAGLWPFVSRARKEINPALIRVFYSNLWREGDVLYSLVKSTPIELSIVGITELIRHASGRPTIHSANPEGRLLLYIVSRIIKPRKHGHTIMSDEDLKLIHAIMHSAPINWAKFVMVNMTIAASTDHDHLLPYPFVVMDILERFKVTTTVGPLTKATKIWAISTKTFKKRSDNAGPATAVPRPCSAAGPAEPQTRANLASIAHSLNRLHFKGKILSVPKCGEYGEGERNEKKKAMVAAESDESSSSSLDEETLVCIERRAEKSNHEDQWTMSEDDTLCLMAKEDADQERCWTLDIAVEPRLDFQNLLEQRCRLPYIAVQPKPKILCIGRKFLDSDVDPETALSGQTSIFKGRPKQRCSSDTSLLSNLIPYDGPKVTFGGSNDFGLTKGLGNLVYKGLTIQALSYVEGLNYNLLSISQFCDKSYSLEFCKDMASLKNISTNKVILTGNRIRNIYELMWEDVKEACLISKGDTNLLWLWHKRLNHLNFKTLNKLSKEGTYASDELKNQIEHQEKIADFFLFQHL